MGDLNGHHQEWLGSTTTNRHGVADFVFATVSCDKLVVGPTHARGGTFDLLITDVPDLVRIAVVASTGNSDNSSLSAVISMVRAVSNMCISRKIFLKHQVIWNTVCDEIQDLPLRKKIVLLTILLRVGMSICQGYEPTNVIRVHNKDKLSLV